MRIGARLRGIFHAGSRDGAKRLPLTCAGRAIAYGAALSWGLMVLKAMREHRLNAPKTALLTMRVEISPQNQPSS